MRRLASIVAASVLATSVACVGREFQPSPTPLPTVNPAVLETARLDTREIAGYFTSVDCLDANGDGQVRADDIEQQGAPDVTLDGESNGEDQSAFANLDLEVAIGGCLQTKQSFISKPSETGVGCDGNRPFVVIAGVVGQSSGDVLSPEAGVGLRATLAAITTKADEAGLPWTLVLATPQIDGATRPNAAMEQWLDLTLSSMLTARPCSALVLVGHSHGAVMASAVASGLEARGLAGRIGYVALIDRVTERYKGETTAVPEEAFVFNAYQRNSTPEVRNGIPLQDTGRRITDQDFSSKPPNVVETPGVPPPTIIDHESIDDDLDIRAMIATEAIARVQALASQ